MAAMSPEGFSMITVNGEEYMPRPHEVNSKLPEDMVWTQLPPNDLFIADSSWYDAMGQDLIMQRRIWAIPTESGQVDQFRQLLHERPDRALDMLFAAAAKGKSHVVRFLLEQGVKATANEAQGDDSTLVPLHAAAYQGHLECVKILVEQGKLKLDTLDDIGGTPLMRACWGKHPAVVQYLLDAGADITVRQTSSSKNEPRPNAFEFAGGSGCVECAKLVIKHAEQLRIHTPHLATPMAAAQSDDLDILAFFLEVGRYPRQNGYGNWEDDISLLTDQMKEAVEGAFQRALQQGRCKALRTLFAYIESRKENDEYHWICLRDETVDALVEAIWQFARHDDEEHGKALVFVFDVLLAQSSRFTTPAAQERKDSILNDAFFWAAQHGCLNMLKLIESKHDDLNVNHLAHAMGPRRTTPLYTAAGSGQNSIVEYLLTEHGEQLNIHLSNGIFANGPTAMWITVWNRHPDTVKLLLERAGGPIDYIDDAAKPGKQMKRAIVTATKAFRSPVRLVSEVVWIKEHGDLDDVARKGSTSDADGNEMNFVVLKLEEDDAAWWDKLELRKNDEELISMEKDGRQLKEKPMTA